MLLGLSLSSCEQDITETIASQNIQESNQQAVVIKNGRLSFQSKEEFAEIYTEYAEASEAKLIQYFQPLYEKGFYSLRPIVSEQNEEFLYSHYMKTIPYDLYRKSNNSNKSNQVNDVFDYLDDLEEIIGDDTFAAFLNNNAEILIGDDVYKYSDVGLFITPENKVDVLNAFLDSKSISQNIQTPTNDSAKSLFYNEVPCGGMVNTVALDEDVSYFSNNPCSGGNYTNNTSTSNSGNSNSSTSTSNTITSSDPSYIAFLNNLSSCAPDSGLFANLFGDNNVCIDQYENRRRVKTKAYNYNYLLVFHLGVKCVNQYKGWTGFWRVDATDEVRLVVESAQFEYDLDAMLGNTTINNLNKERYYFMNNKRIYYNPSSLTLPNWGAPSVTFFNNTALPPIFKDDLSIEFFGTGWDWLDGQIQNGIDSNLKASKLNEYFYGALYSTITSQLKQALGNTTVTPSNRTFVAKFPEQGKVIFQKSVLDQGFNIGVREKTFDWGGSIKLGGTNSANGGWSFSGGVGNDIVRPKNFRVKIIGAARYRSGWHGSKFIVGMD